MKNKSEYVRAEGILKICRELNFLQDEELCALLCFSVRGGVGIGQICRYTGLSTDQVDRIYRRVKNHPSLCQKFPQHVATQPEPSRA